MRAKILMAAVAVPAIRREDCTYTSCYCEENVFKLSQQLVAAGAEAHQLYAAFVSNAQEQVRSIKS